MSDKAVVLRTVSGATVIGIFDAGSEDEAVERAFAMARTAEGIEESPGSEAPISEHGVSQFAVGLPAWEQILGIANRHRPS